MAGVFKTVVSILKVVLEVGVTIIAVWILYTIAEYRPTIKEEKALKEMRDQKKNPLYFLKKPHLS